MRRSRRTRCIGRRRLSGFFRVSPAPPNPYPSPQGGGGSPEATLRHEIVPRALLAEMDLQAVGKEGEETSAEIA